MQEMWLLPVIIQGRVEILKSVTFDGRKTTIESGRISAASHIKLTNRENAPVSRRKAHTCNIINNNHLVVAWPKNKNWRF